MSMDTEIAEFRAWFASPRFEGLTRVYSAREVVEQRGTIRGDYGVARDAAERFYERLRGLFKEGRSFTTFGPYSPGQAVAMKRMGIEGIYLGGWATCAKGSRHRGSGSRPRELSAEPGAGRGRADRPRAAHRRQEPASSRARG